MILARILRDPGALEGGEPSESEARSQNGEAPPTEANDPAANDRLVADRLANLTREVARGEQRLKERETAYHSALRDRELAIALAGQPLVPGAASQLLKLWREELTVREDEGRCQVTARDGRSVSESVADWLSSSEYAHFRPAPSRGGAAIAGTNRPSTTSGAAGPRTLGESILQRWREATTELDPDSRPVGLGRHH